VLADLKVFTKESPDEVSLPQGVGLLDFTNSLQVSSDQVQRSRIIECKRGATKTNSIKLNDETKPMDADKDKPEELVARIFYRGQRGCEKVDWIQFPASNKHVVAEHIKNINEERSPIDHRVVRKQSGENSTLEVKTTKVHRHDMLPNPQVISLEKMTDLDVIE